jgi:hypothetical protein
MSSSSNLSPRITEKLNVTSKAHELSIITIISMCWSPKGKSSAL